MPYITQRQQHDLDMRGKKPTDPGELTYVLTGVVIDYVLRHGVRYRTFAEVIGSLAQTADEFRRRIIHPYEAAKAEENGDVYARLTRLLP